MRTRALVLSCAFLSIVSVMLASACTSPQTTLRDNASNDAGGGGSSGGPVGGGDDGTPPNGDPTGTNTPHPVAMTITRESTTVAGQTRSYILAVPQNYDASKTYPLVLALHGNPGSADEMLSAFPFDAIGGAAVVAYPQGSDGNWDLNAEPSANVDMPFVQMLPNEIATKVHADTTRVFAFGFSGGAFFANQITCVVPGVFKAFASHSGGAPYGQPGTPWPNGCMRCTGSPTPAIMIHGSADTEVSLDDGKYDASCWATTNGCWQDPDGWPVTTPSMCKRVTTCANASPMEMCIVDGMGHEPWQQAPQVAWSFFNSVQ
jgi:polyhydroxybutyrate depolymerase